MVGVLIADTLNVHCVLFGLCVRTDMRVWGGASTYLSNYFIWTVNVLTTIAYFSFFVNHFGFGTSIFDGQYLNRNNDVVMGFGRNDFGSVFRGLHRRMNGWTTKCRLSRKHFIQLCWSQPSFWSRLWLVILINFYWIETVLFFPPWWLIQFWPRYKMFKLFSNAKENSL